MADEKVPTLGEDERLPYKFLPEALTPENLADDFADKGVQTEVEIGRLSEGVLEANLSDQIVAEVPPAVDDYLATDPTVAQNAASLAQSDAGLLRDEDLPTLFTNLFPNPSFETNIANAQTTGGGVIALTRVTSEARFGTASLQVVTDGANANQGAVIVPAASLPAGTYTASAWVKAAAGTSLRFAAGVATPIDFTATGSWQRLSLTTSRDTSALTGLAVSSPTATPVTFYLDGCMQVEGALAPEFFDGDSPGCAWLGTAHASSSIKYAPSAGDRIDRSSLPILSRNLLPNPSIELSTNFWQAAATGASIARSTSNPYLGAAHLRLTCDGTNVGQRAETTPTSGSPRVTPGNYYTASAFIKANAGTSLTIEQIYLNELGVALGSGFTAFTASGTYQRVVATSTPPAGAARCQIKIRNVAAVPNVVDIDAVQVEQSTGASAYTDGDRPGCYWTGTPHASESVRLAHADAVVESRTPELARNLVRVPNGLAGISSGLVGGQWSSALGTLGVNGKEISATATADGNAGLTMGGYGNPERQVVVKPNTAYVMEAKFRVSGPSRTVRMDYAYVNASLVPTPAYVAGPVSATATSSGYVTVRQVVVSPADAVRLRLVPFGLSMLNGETVYVTDVMVREAGSLYQEFFDGDSLGCRWTGQPYASESVRYLASPQDYSMLTWLDVGRAQGVGSPEGAVVAPVGTRYVDTAATNGAIEWIKASGTGATGWRVAYGDTGDRRITTPGSIATAPNLEVAVRRVGDTVTVIVTEPTAGGTLSGSGVTLAAVPVGFRPTFSPGTSVAAGLLTTNTGVQLGTVSVISTEVRGHGMTSGARHYSTCVYFTEDPWPTTLPGTPV